MREIKFRAINSSNEIIYGLPYTDGVNETAYYKEFNNRLCWRNEDGAHCNQPYKNGTLMQFTGLYTKSGVEIYEGDMIDHPGNVVEFSFGGFNVNGDTPLCYYTNCQVIGNIYVNTELLEVAQ